MKFLVGQNYLYVMQGVEYYFVINVGLNCDVKYSWDFKEKVEVV